MTPVVEVVDVTRTFGSRRGVADLSFAIGPGEVFGFLGPNGAGKTTTIRLLLGLIRPTSGTARVFGLDPVQDAIAVHRRTGYLAGDLALYPRLTGRQHLDRLGRARGVADRRYRDELVERFGVELDRPVRVLSKGNRQKIGLVPAFLHRPDLLVLDEPTSGLDPLLQDEFGRLVRETVAEGRTVLLSSHELDEVQRLVDRLTILREGRVVVTDTVAGLRRAAPRTVSFRFGDAVDPQRFAGLAGTRVVAATDGQVTLAMSGPVAPALRLAGELGAVDVTARPGQSSWAACASLDETGLWQWATVAPRVQPDRYGVDRAPGACTLEDREGLENSWTNAGSGCLACRATCSARRDIGAGTGSCDPRVRRRQRPVDRRTHATAQPSGGGAVVRVAGASGPL